LLRIVFYRSNRTYGLVVVVVLVLVAVPVSGIVVVVVLVVVLVSGIVVVLVVVLVVSVVPPPQAVKDATRARLAAASAIVSIFAIIKSSFSL
jgi:hypothetical protein